jgi:mannose-1-phosphate guanylyltransferase
MKAEQVLCEPFRKNTAPCVAYANFKITELCPDANVIVAPADHLVLNEQRFEEIIDLAIEEASETQNLVTLGIKPSRPDTGYGYIQFEDKSDARDTRVKTVKTFTEKPDIDLARKFLASGEFYWNSGIFIWSLDNIQAAYKRDLPDVYSLFKSGKSKYNTDEELDYIQEIYAKCENISIDYGIMEKANNVSLILSDFGWSDLGTWGSLYTHVDLDLHNNATVGDNTMLYSCTNNMVYSADDKLTVLHGLDGFIVVDTPEAMLICKKSDEQKIKQFVTDIKINKKDEFL